MKNRVKYDLAFATDAMALANEAAEAGLHLVYQGRRMYSHPWHFRRKGQLIGQVETMHEATVFIHGFKEGRKP